MELKVNLIHDAAVIPTYGTPGAACFDLYATDTVAIAPGRAATVQMGIKVEVPEGHVLKLFSRSGHGFKHGVRLCNTTGIIDSDFRGELVARLHNDGKEVFLVSIGDRVVQGMVVPVERCEFVTGELSVTERGEAGFGSTDKPAVAAPKRAKK